MNRIDLRSDTVTHPSRGMREAMAKAEVGDDVFGDDPTVNKLQEVLAQRFGMQAGLCFPLGTPVKDLCAGFDTVSVCLSKGLGTPAGTVLVGRNDVIDRARRIRKMLGGTMRQVGILAAAGLYALEHNVARLAEDHANAERLGKGLAALGLKVDPVQTNMVFAAVPQESVAALKEHLERN